jgi:hypothetical protein
MWMAAVNTALKKQSRSVQKVKSTNMQIGLWITTTDNMPIGLWITTTDNMPIGLWITTTDNMQIGLWITTTDNNEPSCLERHKKGNWCHLWVLFGNSYLLADQQTYGIVRTTRH